MDNKNNNSDDAKSKKSPAIEVDPITGKITVKEEQQSENHIINDKKGSQQNKKRLIEPHHSPDDPALEEERERKKNIFLSLSQKILGNQSRSISKKNLDIAQNIGQRMNRLGIKFLGHINIGKSNNLTPQTPLTGKNQGKDNERDLF